MQRLWLLLWLRLLYTRPLLAVCSIMLVASPLANGTTGSLFGAFTMIEKPDYYGVLAP